MKNICFNDFLNFQALATIIIIFILIILGPLSTHPVPLLASYPIGRVHCNKAFDLTTH